MAAPILDVAGNALAAVHGSVSAISWPPPDRVRRDLLPALLEAVNALSPAAGHNTA